MILLIQDIASSEDEADATSGDQDSSRKHGLTHAQKIKLKRKISSTPLHDYKNPHRILHPEFIRGTQTLSQDAPAGLQITPDTLPPPPDDSSSTFVTPNTSIEEGHSFQSDASGNTTSTMYTSALSDTSEISSTQTMTPGPAQPRSPGSPAKSLNRVRFSLAEDQEHAVVLKDLKTLVEEAEEEESDNHDDQEQENQKTEPENNNEELKEADTGTETKESAENTAEEKKDTKSSTAETLTAPTEPRHRRIGSATMPILDNQSALENNHEQSGNPDDVDKVPDNPANNNDNQQKCTEPRTFYQSDCSVFDTTENSDGYKVVRIRPRTFTDTSVSEDEGVRRQVLDMRRTGKGESQA